MSLNETDFDLGPDIRSLMRAQCELTDALSAAIRYALDRARRQEAKEATRIGLTPSEVAHRLGFSRSRVWRLMREGQIPTYRVGRLRRVSHADLESCIERWGRKPEGQVL